MKIEVVNIEPELRHLTVQEPMIRVAAEDEEGLHWVTISDGETILKATLTEREYQHLRERITGGKFVDIRAGRFMSGDE